MTAPPQQMSEGRVDGGELAAAAGGEDLEGNLLARAAAGLFLATALAFFGLSI